MNLRALSIWIGVFLLGLFSVLMPIMFLLILVTMGVSILLLPLWTLLPIIAFPFVAWGNNKPSALGPLTLKCGRFAHIALTVNGYFKWPLPYISIFVFFTLIDLMLILLTKR